jgi:phosphate transport system substrate-binding protein
MFKHKPLFVVLALLGVAAFAGACSSATPPPQPTGIAKPTAAPKSGAMTINGAGATFPFPLYSRWFYEYAFVDSSVKFNYQSIGSGGGIAQITAKTVDFGASDAILTAEQYQKAPGVQMFPTVAGAIVPIYNVKGDDGKALADAIKFPYTALADIYLGKIKKWNDPVLAQANPNLKLPAKDIIVVARSDGSGTTFAFTDYLSQVSPEWKDKVGNATSVKWRTGLGGKGNEGVAGTVAQNDGAIGYVEFAYAKQNKLAYGSAQNKAGAYVSASTDAVQAAMVDFGSNMGDRLALSIANAPGKNSWPIASYTYLLLYMDQTDCAKAKKVVNFVQWALSDQGAKFAKELDYVPLPNEVQKQVLEKLGQVTCNGKSL